MELGALVRKVLSRVTLAFLASAQGAEVLNSFGNRFAIPSKTVR